MKKLILLSSIVCTLVCLAFSWLMDVRSWKDLFKNLICSFTAAAVVLLAGAEYKWSGAKILLGVIVASAYARPLIFGINRQLREFFKDPKAFIDKYKDLR